MAPKAYFVEVEKEYSHRTQKSFSHSTATEKKLIPETFSLSPFSKRTNLNVIS